MKIMIVDDHEGMRGVLKSILTHTVPEPLHIVECESGEEAIIRYAFYQPDCVLMDFEMHEMNGFEATQIIRNQDQTANIVIVTGYDSPSMRQNALELQVKGFIAKDNLSELQEILQTIIS